MSDAFERALLRADIKAGNADAAKEQLARVKRLDGGLRGLVENATPGEWLVDAEDGLDVVGEHAIARIAGPWTMGEDADPGVRARALSDARLIAFAPSLALWAADAADFMADIEAEFSELAGADWFEREWHALLARFAVIQNRAQEGTP